MKLKDFLDLYDNWCDGIVTINDDNETNWEFNPVFRQFPIQEFYDTYKNAPVMEKEILAFGFYDGELTIRIDFEAK